MPTYSFGLMRKFSTGRLGVVLAVVSTFLVAAAPMLAAPAAHAAKADNATEMKAREAFAAGRYDEALDLFAKLYAQTLHPVYLRNIGRCHQKMRQPEQAIDKFNEYLAKEKKISADERKEIDGYIKEMETLRDEQARQKAPPPPAAAGHADQRRQQPPPPPPNYNYYPPPPPTGTTSGTLVAQPPPPQEDAPIYKKWWFWTGIGAVVVAAASSRSCCSSGTTRPDCPASALDVHVTRQRVRTFAGRRRARRRRAGLVRARLQEGEGVADPRRHAGDRRERDRRHRRDDHRQQADRRAGGRADLRPSAAGCR